MVQIGTDTMEAGVTVAGARTTCSLVSGRKRTQHGKPGFLTGA